MKNIHLLPTQVYPPKNIDIGLVVCGHRHSNCIDIMKSLSGLKYFEIFIKEKQTRLI